MKSILAIYYSQTGQLREIITNFLSSWTTCHIHKQLKNGLIEAGSPFSDEKRFVSSCAKWEMRSKLRIFNQMRHIFN